MDLEVSTSHLESAITALSRTGLQTTNSYNTIFLQIQQSSDLTASK